MIKHVGNDILIKSFPKKSSMRHTLYMFGFLTVVLAAGIFLPTVPSARAAASARFPFEEARFESRREVRRENGGCREAVVLEVSAERGEAEPRRDEGFLCLAQLLVIVSFLVAAPRCCRIFRLPDSHFLLSQYIPRSFQGRAPPVCVLN